MFYRGIFHIVVTFCVFNVIGFKVKMHIRIYFIQWVVGLIIHVITTESLWFI